MSEHDNRLLDLELAYAVLGRIVRAEYPEGTTLAGIVETWGLEFGATPEELEALERLEAAEGETGG